MSDRPAVDRSLPDGTAASVTRRAPFAGSPYVGERGHRAQMRILDAALEVFGEVGYHACGVRAITELSGCSRASFYQYFSSKEDLFRHLAGRVVRQLNESAAALEPITGDQAGWQSFADWLERYVGIYETYEPVFVAFETARDADEMVASGAVKVASRSFTDMRRKIEGSPLESGAIDDVVRTLFDTVAGFNRERELLEIASPTGALPRKRYSRAFVDVFHRALFGPIEGVNVHTPKGRLRPLVAAEVEGTSELDGDLSEHGPAALQTRAELIEAGHRVFIEKGYYATRVADIAKAAGVSHGVFYRYFENKTHLFHILALRAGQRLSAALDGPLPLELKAPEAAEQRRSWLRTYAETYAEEAAIHSLWRESMAYSDELGELSMDAIENARGRLARALAVRGWGDADAEGLVLLVFLDALASHRVTAKRVETAAAIIERGMLTPP